MLLVRGIRCDHFIRAAAEISRGDGFSETTNSPGQSLQQWTWRLGAGKRLPQGQQSDLFQWPGKCTTQTSCYERLISPAVSPLNWPLHSHQGHAYPLLFQGTTVGSFCDRQTPLGITLHHRLPVGLNLSWNSTVLWALLTLSPSTGDRPLLRSESSPCLSCSILQEISCISNNLDVCSLAYPN